MRVVSGSPTLKIVVVVSCVNLSRSINVICRKMCIFNLKTYSFRQTEYGFKRPATIRPMRTNSSDADDAAPPSRMAVVFVVRGGFSNVQKTLDCLLAQTAANRIDLMLTTDSPALLQEIERYVLSRGTLVNPRFLLHAAPENKRCQEPLC